MKRPLFALLLLLISTTLNYGQNGSSSFNGSTTNRPQTTDPTITIRAVTVDPTNCNPTGPNVIYRTDLGQIKVCTAANTWTAITGGGGGGATVALDNLAAVAINTDLLPASTQSLGNASFPFASSFTGSTTQYESVVATAGVITHQAAGSATNISLVLTTKGTGKVNITDNAAGGAPILTLGAGSTFGPTFYNGGWLFYTPIGDNIWMGNMASNPGIRLTSGYQIGWVSSAGDATNAPLVGLGYNASGQLQVTNGVLGQWGSLFAGVRDAGTTTVVNGLTLGHQSTATPAAGLGIGVQFNLNSTTTADQSAAQINAAWTDATHATRTAKISFLTVTNAGALAAGLTVNQGAAVLTSYTVATLPSASGAGAGAMAYVTDSTATAITGLGLAVVGSGGNKVVVVSDGTNWIVQ